ncbi:hypothetical protein [Streptomyces sp. NRRL F-2580]|uniref:hypothetical protein n=1 Tax=Streptomyces sp. NRRL F-2580 TaxID=1463841 RepID=UPI00131C4475|nr:hypothetical protein [Streptomyces sp. NRRL F-2580]
MAASRRPLACALLGLAAALVATALAAYRWGGSHGGLVVMSQVRGHVVVLGWLTLAALCGAVLLGLRKPMTRVAVGVPVLGLGAPVMCLATLLALLDGGQEQTRSLAAPGRDDRRLVVEEGSAMIDPLWYVYVHEGGWPRERRWAVGYFNGDDPDNELREAVWTGPDRIRMTTSGGAVHEVTVAAGGRPDRTVSAGW